MLRGVTGCYWMLLGDTGVLLGVTGCCRVFEGAQGCSSSRSISELQGPGRPRSIAQVGWHTPPYHDDPQNHLFQKILRFNRFLWGDPIYHVFDCPKSVPTTPKHVPATRKTRTKLNVCEGISRFLLVQGLPDSPLKEFHPPGLADSGGGKLGVNRCCWVLLGATGCYWV
jgi:hypothetical protein